MIVVEGYKAFTGKMLISPKNPDFKPFTVTGDWLYKPDMKCWYCKGRSYMEAVCTVLSDDTYDLLKAKEEGRLVVLPPSAKEGDPKPECFYNDNAGLWCLGLSAADGDEPTERCKRCWYCESGYSSLEDDTSREVQHDRVE